MATTVRDVIAGSFRLLAGDDQTFGADDYKNAMYSLNSMLQTWTTEGLTVYTINRTVLPLTIGVQAYTLGTGGTLNMARPTWIENMSVIPTGISPLVEIPIKILLDEDWQQVLVKSVASTFPIACYPQGDFPLNTLNFWPIPTVACSVVLYTPGSFGDFQTINDAVSFPNGYERAMRYNLAMEIAPEYGIEVSSTVQGIAYVAKNQIRARNHTPVFLRSDNALLSGGNTADVFNKSWGYVAP